MGPAASRGRRAATRSRRRRRGSRAAAAVQRRAARATSAARRCGGGEAEGISAVLCRWRPQACSCTICKCACPALPCPLSAQAAALDEGAKDKGKKAKEAKQPAGWFDLKINTNVCVAVWGLLLGRVCCCHGCCWHAAASSNLLDLLSSLSTCPACPQLRDGPARGRDGGGAGGDVQQVRRDQGGPGREACCFDRALSVGC